MMIKVSSGTDYSEGVSLHTVTKGYRGLDRTDILVFNGMPSVAFDDLLPPKRELTFSRVQMAAFDRRGMGSSTDNLKTVFRHHSYSELAEDSKAVVDALGMVSVYLIARSGGVPDALEFARKYPNRVKGVVVQGAALPKSIMGEDWDDGMEATNAAILNMKPGRLYKHIKGLSHLIDRQDQFAPYELTEFPPGLNEYAMRDIKNWPLFGSAAYHVSYRRSIKNGIGGWVRQADAFYHDWGINFGEINQPVLVQSYGEDPYGRHGKKLAELLPNAAYFVDEDASHFQALNELLPFSRILRARDTGEDRYGFSQDPKWAEKFAFFQQAA